MDEAEEEVLEEEIVVEEEPGDLVPHAGTATHVSISKHSVLSQTETSLQEPLTLLMGLQMQLLILTLKVMESSPLMSCQI
jgi:hypothetical protein